MVNLDKETVIIINSMNQNAKGYELMMIEREMN